MSSVMQISMSSLKELLSSTKAAVQSNDYFSTAFDYSVSSYGFAREHKAEIVGAGLAGFTAWYLA